MAARSLSPQHLLCHLVNIRSALLPSTLHHGRRRWLQPLIWTCLCYSFQSLRRCRLVSRQTLRGLWAWAGCSQSRCCHLKLIRAGRPRLQQTVILTIVMTASPNRSRKPSRQTSTVSRSTTVRSKPALCCWTLQTAQAISSSKALKTSRLYPDGKNDIVVAGCCAASDRKTYKAATTASLSISHIATHGFLL